MKRKDFDRIKNLVNQMLEKGAYDDHKDFEKTGVKSESFYTFHLKILIHYQALIFGLLRQFV